MTTNESPDISRIVDVMNVSDDLDPYTLIAELKPFLTGPAHIALALAFDMCPIHDQDLDSCRDDVSAEIEPTNDIAYTACAHYWTR